MKKKTALLLTCLVCAALFWAVRAEVRINEVLAAPVVFKDERSDDWLELYNDSDEDVDLSGWHLSNTFKRPDRFTFPGGTVIKAHGYLGVYCVSNDDPETRLKNTLYANFALSASGRTVYLTDPEGNTRDTLEFPRQYANISYGRIAGKDECAYFETPTPGRGNPDSGCADRAPMPVFETAPGFYDDDVRVKIRCESGYEIRYTTDCSTPDRDSARYTEPIKVTRTTVIRAVAVKKGSLVSDVAGGSFIIGEGTYPVPVVSIYTDDKYFYSREQGIMVDGSGKVKNYNLGLEPPCQIEYFDENGVQQISQMATCKISGHSSRSAYQKSLTVYARSAFGSDSFRYPFFENREYDTYSALLLRNTSSDALSCRLRDPVFSEIGDGLGLYYAAGRPIVVYINGKYYGHYNLREKANKDSLARFEGITDEDVIAGCTILEGAGIYSNQVVRGDNEEWVELMKFCSTADMSDPENVKYITDRIDVDSMFNFAIYSSLLGSTDYGNVRVYRFPGEKWKYMIHDIEAGGMNTSQTPIGAYLADRSVVAELYPHWPLKALLEVDGYRELFLRRLSEITESNFLYHMQVEPIFDRWMEQLEQILPKHFKKYPKLSLSGWRTNVKAVMYYVRLRPKYVIGYYCEALNVTEAEKQIYFGETLALLERYNAKEI